MSRDTPMFRQYLELRAQVPDAMLFFRMGDFYELFFDDAKLAAQELELTLTSRNKGADDPIPMAGVPHHAARGYIQTLVERGHKVAIADQVEDPKQAKGLVRRDIVRVVSPGVALDPESANPREACWLVGLLHTPTWGLALLDVTTGDLRVTEPQGRDQVLEELARISPREVVLPASLQEDAELVEALRGVALNPIHDTRFDVPAAQQELARRLEVRDLSGFGAEDLGPSLAAAVAVLDYARHNLRGELPQLRGLRPYAVSGFMVLDAATRRNLELFKPLMGSGRSGTLLGLMDRSATAMGGRMLREWLSYPLLDPERIRARLDAVESLVDDGLSRADLVAALKQVSDIERLASKLAQRTANARDLVRLAESLLALPQVTEAVSAKPALAHLVPRDPASDVAARIQRDLVDEPPVALTEGGLFRQGVDPELDELVTLSREGKSIIAKMEQAEREVTGISSLKVKYNKVFGYFIEVSKANLHRVPEHYLRKQTLTNAERYITPELKELEEKVLGADERRKALEHGLFVELRDALGEHVGRLQAVARCLAELDVYGALAELASDNHYVRPVIDTSRALRIEAGRHPVVEQMDLGEAFVPNDLHLDPAGRQVLLVTGPNMSGKSTIMRQTALIALMAQLGSFVPASAAQIGICDRIFTRVGASDDLATGRSTFMVEMSETANILHHATERSLVILDEIGRGTSTYDGVAIAWSVAEALHDQVRARTLFATHYHELLELADTRANVANVSVAVSEWGDRILFLRRLKDGGTSRSYGIQCARLAGMPQGVVDRAKTLLVELEKHNRANPGPQLSLFGRAPADPTPAPVPASEVTDSLREALADIDPDALTPRQALDALYRLKELG